MASQAAARWSDSAALEPRAFSGRARDLLQAANGSPYVLPRWALGMMRKR